MSSKIAAAANDIVVRWRAPAVNLTSTISSRHFAWSALRKVPARRAPELGEHNDEVLEELGFDATQIDGLRVSGAIPRKRAKAS